GRDRHVAARQLGERVLGGDAGRQRGDGEGRTERREHGLLPGAARPALAAVVRPPRPPVEAARGRAGAANAAGGRRASGVDGAVRRYPPAARPAPRAAPRPSREAPMNDSAPPSDLTRTTVGVLFLVTLAGASLWVMRPFLLPLVWATT